VDAWRTGNLGAITADTLYDPFTGNADGTGRVPLPGNIVPTSRINPIATKLMSYIPEPNMPGEQNNYILNVPTLYDGNSFDGRQQRSFAR
jgi:hypothetical protein